MLRRTMAYLVAEPANVLRTVLAHRIPYLPVLVGKPTVEVLRYSFVVCALSVVSASPTFAQHYFGLVRAFSETCVPDRL